MEEELSSKTGFNPIFIQDLIDFHLKNLFILFNNIVNSVKEFINWSYVVRKQILRQQPEQF